MNVKIHQLLNSSNAVSLPGKAHIHNDHTGHPNHNKTISNTSSNNRTRTRPPSLSGTCTPQRSLSLTSGDKGSTSIGFGKLHTSGNSKKRDIETSLMENATRKAKHYGYASTARKVELASRNKPDRETGDPGALMVPSTYSARRTSAAFQVMPDRSSLYLSPRISEPERRTVRFLEDENDKLVDEPEQMQIDDSVFEVHPDARWKSDVSGISLDSQNLHSNEHMRDVPVLARTTERAYSNVERRHKAAKNICTYFVNRGWCKFGEKCWDSHDNNTPATNANLPPVARGGDPYTTCFYWALSTKSCKKRAGECLFAHAITPSIGRSPVPPQSAIGQEYWQIDENLRLETQRSFRKQLDQGVHGRLVEYQPDSFHLDSASSSLRSLNPTRPIDDTQHPAAEHMVMSALPTAARPSAPTAADKNLELTCFFWAIKYRFCTKNDEECKFAHAWALGISSNPNKNRGNPAQEKADEDERSRLNDWLASNPFTEPPPEVRDGTAPSFIPSRKVCPGGNATVTCWFWGSEDYPGRCDHNDGECFYAHEGTGRIQMDPKKGGGWEVDDRWLAAQKDRQLREVEYKDDDQKHEALSQADADNITVISGGTPEPLSTAHHSTDSNITALDVSSEHRLQQSTQGHVGTESSNLRVTVTLGNGKQTRFSFLDGGGTPNTALMQKLSSQDIIIFDKQCLAIDFVSSGYQTLSQGLVSSDPETDTTVVATSDYLRTALSGLCFVGKEFSILIFPTKAEGWHTLDNYQECDPKFILKYLAFRTKSYCPQPLAPDVQTTPQELTAPYQKSLYSWIHRLNYKALVPKASQKSILELYLHFFLIFPDSAVELSDMLSLWLASSNARAAIFDSKTKGSWFQFMGIVSKSGAGGCVLIHCTMLPIIDRFPYLRRLLAPSVVIWSVSNGPYTLSSFQPLAPDKGLALGNMRLSRLFPHGAAFFLTPSFVLFEPRKTHEILEWFKNKHSMPGTYKLVVCHRFRELIYEHAIAKNKERKELLRQLEGQPDAESILNSLALTNAVCVLRYLSYQLIDTIVPQRNLSEDLFPLEDDDADERDSPIVYMDPHINQLDEKTQAEWYVGWTMLRLNTFRKFLVVGTDETSPNPEDMEMIRTMLAPCSKNSGKEPAHADKSSRLDIKDPTKSSAFRIAPTSKTSIMDGSSDERSPTYPNHNSELRNASPSTRKPATVFKDALEEEGIEENGSNEQPHEVLSSLKLGVTYIAIEGLPPSTRFKLSSRRNDKIKIIKYVSGNLYLAENLRTGCKGQITADKLARITSNHRKSNTTNGRHTQQPDQSPSQYSRLSSATKPDIGLTHADIKPPSSHQIADFRTITGASKELSIKLLSKAENNLCRAVKDYFKSIDPDSISPIEDQISETWGPRSERALAAMDCYYYAGLSSLSLEGSMDGPGSEIGGPVRPSSFRESVSHKSMPSRARYSEFCFDKEAHHRNDTGYDSQAENADKMTGVKGTQQDATGAAVQEQPKYEPTTVWYAKRKSQGKSWEHIEVAGWERCYKTLGVLHKKV